jgi:hypothetical protein
VTAWAALYNLAHARLALGDQRQAREHLADAALLCRETGDLGNLSYVLDALAVAGAGPERVAVLVGAAEALREAIGSTVYGHYGPDVDLRVRAAALARRDLGEDAYLRAFDAGHRSSPDEAVELASPNAVDPDRLRG